MNVTSDNKIQKSIAVGILLAAATCLPTPSLAHSAHHHRAYRQPASRAEAPLSSRSLEWMRGTPLRAVAATPTAPVNELRAMWVVRDSIETPERIAHVVATAKEYGFNALFVQVRGRGDAWYDSKIVPRAEELSNELASFDPLRTIITEAHAQGIQVHAWVNTNYVWSAGHKPLNPEHVVNAHPDWLEETSDGKFRLSADGQCEGAFLAPSNPEVRQHLIDVMMEIVNNYDIDGLHLDYIRYPNHNYDFSPAAEQEFVNYLRPQMSSGAQAKFADKGPADYIHAFPDQWADWRRGQVTELVEDISHDVKSAKPWVCMSAAVFADWPDAYHERGQDWKRWLRDGALDAVVPMAYSSNTAVVSAQLKDAEDAAKAAHRACYAGIGSWHISSASTIAKLDAARQDGVQGIVLFSYGGITNDGSTNNYLAKVDAGSFGTPANLPHLASVGARPTEQQAQATPDVPQSAS